MEYEERNALGGLISTFIVVIVFGGKLWAEQLSGTYDGPVGVQIWAQNVLWMVPVSVLICIGVVVAVNIIYAILSGSPRLNTLADERDVSIGRRAMRVCLVVASLGCVAAIGTLAAGGSALMGFNIILGGFVAGDLSGNISKLLAYRMNI